MIRPRRYCVTGPGGAVSAAMSLMSLLALAACRQPQESAPAIAPSSGPGRAPVASGAALVPLPPLGRADLLGAAAAAADATAATHPLPGSNRDLIDRAFELNLPLGCPAGRGGTLGAWQVDRSGRVLRVKVIRQNWTDDRLFAALAAGMAFDAAEGFWIERPWTRSETCPSLPRPAGFAPTDTTTTAST